MALFFVVINALLYLLLLHIVWKRKRCLDCGVVIVSLWAIIACAGIPLYLTDNSWKDHIMLWPFLYLFIAFILYIRYFISDNMTTRMTAIIHYKSSIMDLLCYLYIICVIMNIINDGNSMTMISSSHLVENGADLYAEHFLNEREYKNALDHYSHTYEYYAYLLALIVAFNSLCQGRLKFSMTLLGLVFIKTAMNAAMSGSRSSLVSVVTLYVGLYSLYYKFFSEKASRIFYIGAGILGFIGISYLAAVTIARFALSDEGSGGAVLAYIGQPMLNFNYGIADTDHGYFYGLRTFSNLAEIIGINVPERFDSNSLLGTHFGSGFTTFIGMLCLDFGYIGTLIFGVFLPWLMRSIYFFKGQFGIPSMYIYLFFYNRMINGGFVNGSGADYLYWQAFMYFVILLAIAHFSDILFKRKKNLNFY